MAVRRVTRCGALTAAHQHALHFAGVLPNWLSVTAAAQ
jgi:hypothetical protein